MISRRQLLVLWACAWATTAAHARERTRKALIASLSQSSAAAAKPLTDVLHGEIARLGWREGVEVEYVSRYSDGSAQLETLAAELVALKPDLILAGLPAGALAAQKHTSTIPIVFSFVFDPVALGLVASLGRPAGNVTGTTTRLEGLWGKRLQLVHESLPLLRRIAVVADPADAEDSTTLRELQAAARKLHVEALSFPVPRPEDLTSAFAAMKAQRIDVAVIGGSAQLFVHRKRIAELAIENRLPTFGVTEERADAGMLLSYGINARSQLRATARYVDRILRGARPADLPVEQPTVLKLCVNLKTAKLLGVTIPQAVLLQADRVIE